MWTEVTTREGHRAWTAWDAEQADCGALVVLEHDPEWTRPWVASVLGPTTRDGLSATPDGALRKAGCDLTPPDTFPRTFRRDAERPEHDDRTDTRRERALDAQSGDEVTDDRGRLWWRHLWPYQCWTSRGAGDVHDAERGGMVWATVVRRAVATLPDTLCGLDRLNAASDVLDGRLDALPDGVVVTPEWRQRCADVARVGTVPDDWDDDRPVMAWWGPVDGGCYRWGLSTDPHGTVRTMRSQDPHPARYAKAMGWRAVEVPRD